MINLQLQFTVVGTDMSGNAQTEVITGALGGKTSTGEKVFRKLHQLLLDHCWNINVEIGKRYSTSFL